MKMLIFLLFVALTIETQAEPLSFGVVPQQSAKKLAQLWTPFLEYVSDQTGEDILFKTAKNIPTFEQRLRDGEYDIAYMNPYHFVVFHKTNDYQALVKQKNKKIKGIIVTRKGSEISQLAQLDGETIAFPAPAAFAASIIPRGEMSKMGIDFHPRYVSSHDSVYLNVARGLLPAGGGVIRTFNNTKQEIRDQLNVIWTSKPYTPHAIATHPDLAPERREKIQQVLVQMSESQEGRELLKALNFKGFETALNEDWNDVEELGIESLISPKY